MKTKLFTSCLILAGLLSSQTAFAFYNDDDPPKEEQDIDFTDRNGHGPDNKRTLIPVTASISNEVLTVRFIVSVADATIEVSDALTQSIISQESMAAPAGTCYNYYLTELPEGIYTVSVTNNTNGETVSGEFEVKGNQK